MCNSCCENCSNRRLGGAHQTKSAASACKAFQLQGVVARTTQYLNVLDGQEMLETGEVLHASLLSSSIALVCHDASDCFREPLRLGLCPWALLPSIQHGCSILGSQLHALNPLDHRQDLAFTDTLVVASILHRRQEACYCLQIGHHLVCQGGSRHAVQAEMGELLQRIRKEASQTTSTTLQNQAVVSMTACEHCPAWRHRSSSSCMHENTMCSFYVQHTPTSDGHDTGQACMPCTCRAPTTRILMCHRCMIC